MKDFLIKSLILFVTGSALMILYKTQEQEIKELRSEVKNANLALESSDKDFDQVVLIAKNVINERNELLNTIRDMTYEK